MTTALVRQELGRPKLEAIAFGQAVLEDGVAGYLLEQLDAVRVSGALRTMLTRLEAYGADAFWCDGQAQGELFDRAMSLPLREYRHLAAWSPSTLVALLNQLPPVRRMPDPAWHRQLEEGLAP